MFNEVAQEHIDKLFTQSAASPCDFKQLLPFKELRKFKTLVSGTNALRSADPEVDADPFEYIDCLENEVMLPRCKHSFEER